LLEKQQESFKEIIYPAHHGSSKKGKETLH